MVQAVFYLSIDVARWWLVVTEHRHGQVIAIAGQLAERGVGVLILYVRHVLKCGRGKSCGKNVLVSII